jgi:hypothetical protein
MNELAKDAFYAWEKENNIPDLTDENRIMWQHGYTYAKQINYGDIRAIINLLWKAHKEDIVRDLDWWFGLEDYDFNFFDQEKDRLMSVAVYQGANGQPDYSHAVYTTAFIY